MVSIKLWLGVFALALPSFPCLNWAYSAVWCDFKCLIWFVVPNVFVVVPPRCILDLQILKIKSSTLTVKNFHTSDMFSRDFQCALGCAVIDCDRRQTKYQLWIGKTWDWPATDHVKNRPIPITGRSVGASLVNTETSFQLFIFHASGVQALFFDMHSPAAWKCKCIANWIHRQYIWSSPVQTEKQRQHQTFSIN